MNRNKLLVHVCCGVCMTGLVHKSYDQGYDITGFFFNPNIHPYKEFKRRLRTVEIVQERLKIPFIYDKNYGLVNFLRKVVFKEQKRCFICYQWRLEETAKYASMNGFDRFSTTLMISPQQNHRVIKQIGEDLSKRFQVEFVYQDFTGRYPEAKEFAKKHSLYRQQYCGCVFSEFERFSGKDIVWLMRKAMDSKSR